MSVLENLKEKIKDFKPTTWSIKNKTSIYLLMLFVTFIGISKFVTLPKEQFPDIVIPTIYVQTIYVGNSPKDIENLVSKPIENRSRVSPAPRSIKLPAVHSRITLPLLLNLAPM
jgi:multidrug efflux pump